MLRSPVRRRLLPPQDDNARCLRHAQNLPERERTGTVTDGEIVPDALQIRRPMSATGRHQRRRESVVRADPHYRYEEVASFITGLVHSGTLSPGSRAPSLRQISRQRKTSLSTALQAYRLLEDRGVLEARPQSGFYVTHRSAISLQPPAISKPPGRATNVAISGIVLKLLEYAADPRLAPLGCAIPSAELLAAGRLDRFLARAARVKGTSHNVYTEPKGNLQLRQEIARRALHWGQALSPEDVAITCGCTEALALALKSVCRPGDTVAIESPTYFGLLHAIEALDLKALELPTDATSGIDLLALEKALKRSPVAACLFSSSFNNPLGCTMPDEKKVKVLELLARHQVPLIEDDIYGDIYFGKQRPKPFMALDRRGNTLYCSSFSKTIAPGYRIGWIAAGRHMQRCGTQGGFDALRSRSAAGCLRRLSVFRGLRQPFAPDQTCPGRQCGSDDSHHRPDFSQGGAGQPTGRRFRALAGAAKARQQPRVA